MMETFWFWVMKSVAEFAFAIAIIVGILLLFVLYGLLDHYVLIPYANYKEKKRWMSKDFQWVSDMWRYNNARKYHAYSDWKPWMQEVYDQKRKEFDNGKR